MDDILARLAAPFPPEAISWRVGSTTADKTKGMALAFLDARDVQDRLNEVCGPHWQCEHIVSNSGSKVTCRIGIKFGDEWIWRSNGAGDTDYEAEKGSYSDSLKRAAVLWNVGRYLYDLQSPWVAIEQRGKSFVIAKTEIPALQRLLTGTKEPSARSSRDEFARIETALRNCQNLKALHTCWTTNSSAIANMAAGHRQALTEEKDRCKAVLLSREEVAA